MTYSLDVSQQNLIDLLKANFVQKSYEVAIPEPETLIRDEGGNVQPYIAYQFGDLQDGYSETFGGAATNDFWMNFNVQVVSSDPVISRKLGNKLVKVFLGYSEQYGGQVRKRLGGSMNPIGNMDGTIAAYIMPISFGVKIQLFTDV